MPLDVTLRYPRKVRDQLITLRRNTGLPHYHTLCRWAFCISITDSAPLREHQLALQVEDDEASPDASESKFELPWDRFGQRDAHVLEVLLRQRAADDGVAPTRENLQRLAEAHIQRGVARMSGGKRVRSIADLVNIGLRAQEHSGDSGSIES